MTPSIKQAIATVRGPLLPSGLIDREWTAEKHDEAARLLADTLERLLAPVGGEVEHEPEWTCIECGYCGEGFTTITSGGGSDPVDYDVACPECGSTEIRESPQEALTELVQARDTVVAQLEEVKAREPRLTPDTDVKSYYGIKCEDCGWVGSSKESIGGDDSPMYCPHCFNNGEGKNVEVADADEETLCWLITQLRPLPPSPIGGQE